MQEVRDTDLLRQYARENSDEAFAALVARRVNLVYSVALRKTGSPAAAEEITQAVCIILAKKAEQLSRHAALSGWLYQAARLTAANFLRTEIRRAHREQEAFMQSLPNETAPELWHQIAPMLEDAMGKLGGKERDAVALRFFEGKSFSEIATTIGATENAAKKRVSHALEKLRGYFSRRGVNSTAETISETISAHSVHAAPIGLAKTISAVAITKGAVVSTSTLTLIKGALKIMAWTKMKAAAVVGVAVIFTAGTTTLVIHHEHQQRASDPMLMAGFSKSTNQGLQGHWTGSNTAHPGKTCTVNISGDQIEYRGADPNDWVRGTFVLNEYSEPKEINMKILEPSNTVIFGIYQMSGDKMTIAVAPHGGYIRPVNFTPGPQVDVLELQHD